MRTGLLLACALLLPSAAHAQTQKPDFCKIAQLLYIDKSQPRDCPEDELLKLMLYKHAIVESLRDWYFNNNGGTIPPVKRLPWQ